MAWLLNCRVSWWFLNHVFGIAGDEAGWAALGEEAPRGGGRSDDPWPDHHNDVEPNSPTLVLPSRPRPDFILYPAEPATPATQVHRSRSLPARFHTQAQAPANAPAQAPNARLSFPSSPAASSNQPEVPLCCRRLRLECLLAARRTMDYINDSVEYVRGTYSAAVDTASTVYRAATSKTAQRTVLTTLLFAFLSSVLFGLACVGYLAFYHEYLPDQVTTVPVHLQYGYVA